MLPIGPINQVYGKENRTKFTEDEQITMLTLWCIMRSPLMIGGDMRYFDEFTVSLCNNPELLDLLKNSHSAHPLYRAKTETTETCAWVTTCHNGDLCLALFNLGETETTVSAAPPVEGTYRCYDIWAQKEIGTVTGEISATLLSHDAVIYRLSRK